MVEAEIQRQPVGHVDQILVLDEPAGLFCFQAVVAGCQVGARVVNIVGLGFRCCLAGGKISVSQSAKRLTLPFPLRIETFVDQLPVS